MKRVYTDERFPEVEVVNHGGTQFLVLQNGELTDEFTSYETESNSVSEEYAQRRAHDYFNRVAAHSEQPEQSAAPVDDLPALPAGVTQESPVAQQVAAYLLED